MGDVDWGSVEFTATSKRHLRRHRLWGVGVAIKLSAPLVICCALFAVVFLRMRASMHATYTSSRVAHVMGDRTVSAHSASILSRRPVVIPSRSLGALNFVWCFFTCGVHVAAISEHHVTSSCVVRPPPPFRLNSATCVSACLRP